MDKVPNLTASLDGEMGGCICCSPAATQDADDDTWRFQELEQRIMVLQERLDAWEAAWSAKQDQALDEIKAILQKSK